MAMACLLTPALASGLLPGVLRAELLDTGRAREAVLGPTDLMDAKAAIRRQFAAWIDSGAAWPDEALTASRS